MKNKNMTNTEQELTKYKEAVAYFAKENSEKHFYNSTASHTTIVLSEIFKNVNSELLILTTNFNSKVYNNDYINALKNLIKKDNIKIRIVCLKQIDNEEIEQIIKDDNNTKILYKKK